MRNDSLYSKRGVIGTILLVVFLILGTGVYLWYINEGNKIFEEAANPHSPAPTVVAESTDNQIDTSDWKTYINKAGGYSIQYPNEMFLSPNQDKHPTADPVFTTYDPNNAPGRNGLPQTELKIWILQDELESISFEEYMQTQIEKDRYYPTDVNKSEEKIGNNSFTVLTLENSGSTKSAKVYYISNEKYVHTITTYPADTQRENLRDQILSTFEFLPITGWTVFNEKQQSYSLNYPADWDYFYSEKDSGDLILQSPNTFINHNFLSSGYYMTISEGEKFNGTLNEFAYRTSPSSAKSNKVEPMTIGELKGIFLESGDNKNFYIESDGL